MRTYFRNYLASFYEKYPLRPEAIFRDSHRWKTQVSRAASAGTRPTRSEGVSYRNSAPPVKPQPRTQTRPGESSTVKIAFTCLRGLLYGGYEERYTPLLQLKRALHLSMEAHREGKLYNVGAFFSKKLRELGFFDLAYFYAQRKVA